MRADPLLAVDRLDFCYGRLQVLFGVALRVDRGEAVALLGTNGAGKSTLLRVVAGLEQPSEGHVVFDGSPIDRRSAREILDLGLVLVTGGRGVFPDMTVAENLEMMSLRVRRAGELPTRREAVFDTFPRMADRRSHLAGSLSGGEQQQLALAKAMLLAPTLLCIDELSLGLAPVVVQELLEVVERIRQAGVTLIVVEQSLNIAAAICDRAVFLEKGAVRFEGRTADLLERDDVARAVFLGGPEVRR